MVNTTNTFHETFIDSLALLQRNLFEITDFLLKITGTSQKTVTAVTAGGISFMHLELFDYLSGSSVGVE
jgi:hypothetical protein